MSSWELAEKKNYNNVFNFNKTSCKCDILFLCFGKTISGLPGNFLSCILNLKTLCMQEFSHQYFGLCILVSYTRHIETSRWLVMHVCHRVKIRCK